MSLFPSSLVQHPELRERVAQRFGPGCILDARGHTVSSPDRSEIVPFGAIIPATDLTRLEFETSAGQVGAASPQEDANGTGSADFSKPEIT